MDASQSLTYENRKGVIYYLQQGKTRTGKPMFFVGRKLTGEPAAALPDGYEFYERPENAQVVVRKIKPTPITELERASVEEIIRRSGGLKYFIVEIDGDALVVYTPATTTAEVNEMMSDVMDRGFHPDSPRAAKCRDSYLRRIHYEKMLRFTLIDQQARLYHVERWCSRGSVDGWLGLSGRGRLDLLVENYARHLGEETFFELF